MFTAYENRKDVNIVLVGPFLLRHVAIPSYRSFRPYAPPLGVASLAAVLREKGFSIKLVDPNIHCSSNAIFGEKAYHHLASKIIKLRPDVVGISTISSTYVDAILLAQHLRKQSDRLLLVLGGPHASFLADETLKCCPCIDVVVRGEGEITFTNLICTLQDGKDLKNVNGISYRENGTIISNPEQSLLMDLDDIPFPAYDVIDLRQYNTREISLENGRGCPYACQFCSTATFWQRKVRMKSVKKLLDDIRMLKMLAPNCTVGFLHDLFWVNDDYILDLCKNLLKQSLHITWKAYARVDCVNPALLRLCHKAGCRQLFFGVESGSNFVRKKLGKHFSTERAVDVIQGALEAGISAVVSFMIGIPWENREDLQKTVDLCTMFESLGAQVLLSPYTPLPGSEMFEKLGCLKTGSFFSYLLHVEDGLTENATYLVKQHPSLFPSYHAPAIKEDLNDDVILVSVIHDLLCHTILKTSTGTVTPVEITNMIQAGAYKEILRSEECLSLLLDKNYGLNLRGHFLRCLRDQQASIAQFLLAWLRGAHLQTNTANSI